jgi:hypothetical protein
MIAEAEMMSDVDVFNCKSENGNVVDCSYFQAAFKMATRQSPLLADPLNQLE